MPLNDQVNLFQPGGYDNLLQLISTVYDDRIGKYVRSSAGHPSVNGMLHSFCEKAQTMAMKMHYGNNLFVRNC
jgi:hypothetical protein